MLASSTRKRTGSSPIASFFGEFLKKRGEIPKWPKGTDCKSVGIGSNPSLPRFYLFITLIVKKRASEPAVLDARVAQW